MNPGNFAMNRSYFWIFLLIHLAGKHSAGAHNTYFLPGDAFFHTVLTEETLNRIEEEKNPIFNYSRPEFLDNSLCGYAGFSKLEFRNMPIELKQRLRQVYDELREDVPKRIEIRDEIIYKQGEFGDIAVKTGNQLTREVNGFSVFVVNDTFLSTRFVLGLKYNEDWGEQVTAFGHDRNHVHLESFIQTPEAIAEDWRDSKLVAPLSTECPVVSNKNISVPVLASPSCKFMVLKHPDVQELADADKNNSMYEISTAGVTRYIKKGKHWVRQKPRRLR
ncbi:MAG: hypothetical protein CBE00_00650 [Planctomycetaceae bacterium TMED240]|nr:hypothetical protein [Rhodopirellula sp.]OUX08916.1 MAG: hypothetical protein CBE00_00650 [Planctomycetaceae bacterium TMED240]